MSDSSLNLQRGALYLYWGEKAAAYAERSVTSLRLHHPNLPVHCRQIDAPEPARALAAKTRMAAISPFQSTPYLDVDTVVMGNLDRAFEQAERHGLACTLNECPWMRRYGQLGEQDDLEYNTGVLFFTRAAAPVFEAWQTLSATPSASLWTTADNLPRGVSYDDQASFARALRQCELNPVVLPFNYNFRPNFFRSGFAPIKIWHDYLDPPASLVELSMACQRGVRPVTYFEMTYSPAPAPPTAAAGQAE